MEKRVRNLTGRSFEMSHGLLEGLASRVTTRHLRETSTTEEWGYMIQNGTNQHSNCQQKAAVIRHVELVAKGDELGKVEFGGFAGSSTERFDRDAHMAQP